MASVAARSIDAVRPASRSGAWRVVLGVVLASGGAALLWAGMSDLRPAYLYREATGEGLQSFSAALLLSGGGVLALAAVALLLWASRGARRAPGTALKVAAGCLVLGVAACTIVADWVVRQSGCIGPCG